MTAQFARDEGRGPIWVFTSTKADLVQQLRGTSNGVLRFVSKGRDLFATLHGNLVTDNSRATVDRLWNRFVAAWFEGGSNDPRCDPREDCKGKVAGVAMA